MRLFIDTNAYLSFIETSGESSKSLQELKKLLDQKEIKLVFPTITQDEFYRNFPNIVRKVSDSFDEHVVLIREKQPSFPSMLRKKDIMEKVKKPFKVYEKEIKKLKGKYIKSSEELNEIINYLIKKSEKIKEPNNLFDLAFQRGLKGNPPGKKNGSIGDEIEWEFLLNCCFDDKLAIVSGDKDWKNNPRDETIRINSFLAREWKLKTKKSIKLYNSLGGFINSFTKKDKISKEEIEKEQEAIEKAGNVSLGTALSATSLDPRYLSLNGQSTILNLEGDGTVRLAPEATGLAVGTPIYPKLRCSCGEELDSQIYTMCKKCRQDLGINI